MKWISVTLLLISCGWTNAPLVAQGWTVKVQTEGFEGDQLLLAYYLGNSQYIRDTAAAEDRVFTFSGQDTLIPGVYMVVFPPDNQFFQLLVAEGEDDIRVKVNAENLGRPTLVKGSAETLRFYDYIDFLQEQRPRADALRQAIDTLPESKQKADLESELTALNASVRKYQENIISKHPHTLTALLIASNLDVDIPDFTGTEEEIQMQTYRFVRAHYFDRMPMDDPRLCRTPVLQSRVDYYINKLTHQIPDSINISIDYILSRFDTNSEAFRVYLVYFLNTYAKSKIVGMDAVYVHLVDNYYAKGFATWTEEEILNKILKNAETLRPLLIGKTAPDIIVYDKDNHPVQLHRVEAPITVLFFWAPDCGHCKKAIPMVQDFYQKYHDKGVELFAVCTALKDEVSDCWKAVDERGMEDWINVADPYLRSRFKQIYDIRTTPQIYVLDEDKTIVMKKIGAEQLPEVLDHLLENGS